MFEQKLTKRAKNAINLAGQIAMEMGHKYVGTEHLLAGLIKEGGGVAAKVLAENGVFLRKIETKIDFFVGLDLPITIPTVAFTPRTKSVLEHSYNEARKLGHSYIGTEHILISLLRESDSLAVRILSDLGINIQKVYADILKLITDNKAENLSEPNPTSEVANGRKGPKNAEKTPILDKHGRDLTKLARELKLDPIIGRDDVIERIIQP